MSDSANSGSVSQLTTESEKGCENYMVAPNIDRALYTKTQEASQRIVDQLLSRIEPLIVEEVMCLVFGCCPTKTGDK